jgi:DNA polymerase III subunit delta'
MSEDLPSASLFEGIVGQRTAVSNLRSAAKRPVHAYLVVGPPGLQQRELVRGFAAALICPQEGCGHCSACRRVLAGTHPDLVEIHRAGAQLAVDDARRVVRVSHRRPLEAARQVVVVPDVHLARLAAPVLLKTLEEPPGSTILVLLTDAVTPEIATVASRCVRIELSPVAQADLAGWLRSRGVDPEVADKVATAAGGSPEKARLLVDDPEIDRRREMWRTVPAQLDGTGATVVRLAEQLLEHTSVALEPLRARHGAEIEDLTAAAKASGERGLPGRREIEDRHKREERRLRTDELRAGLAELARAYRDRAREAAAESSAHSTVKLRAVARSCDAVGETAIELIRNPNEMLLLEGLFLRLTELSEA